jgi:SAM-dependent methyltransferase
MQPDLTSAVLEREVCGGIDLLRRFLQAYWLRPENAFWMTLRSETLARYALDRPSIDIACGDGVFTFLHCGGTFDPAFDVFLEVGGLDRVTDEHADMFDNVSADYQPAIVAHPDDVIDVGADLKPALLAKAGCLDLYAQLVEHDANELQPFDQETFQTVYCNAAYWVTNIDLFLHEMRRVTRPGGRIILQVKLDSTARYTLESHRESLGDRFLDIIGRGRTACWPTLADRSTWEKRFADAGLEIDEATPFVTKTHAHIWDVGLRPLAPLLVKMANALTPETRSSIKREWVDLFLELLTPICRSGFDVSAEADDPAEMQYVLTPR